MSINATQDFLADLHSKRGCSGGGSNSVWLMELNGATIIEPTAFEPDPVTHRNDYYYNATQNVLYRRIIVRKLPVIVAHWKRVSQ
jgi:hypothetical protein